MPLIKGKSDAAFSHNVAAEMHAGKPMKQSLAIAYAMKRRAKKMADGGQVIDPEKGKKAADAFKNALGFEDGGEVQKPVIDPNKGKKTSDAFKKTFGFADGGTVKPAPTSPPIDVDKGKKVSDAFMKVFANGGFVDEELASGYAHDLVDRIMHERAYSEGGEVANATPPIADSESAEFDDLVLDDDLEFHETGANSGDEIGDEAEDKDQDDMVGQIMASRKKKDKMPRPA